MFVPTPFVDYLGNDLCLLVWGNHLQKWALELTHHYPVPRFLLGHFPHFLVGNFLFLWNRTGI